MLDKLNITIEEFGTSSFRVISHPTWFIQGKEEEIVRQIIELILVKEKNFSLYPDTFVITGESDIVKDEGFAFYEKLHSFNENSKYLNVEFLEHGFIDFTDDNIKEEIYNKIKEFL